MKLTRDSFGIDRVFARPPWSWRWSMTIFSTIVLLIPLALIWMALRSDPSLKPGAGVLRILFPGIVTTYLLIVVHLLQGTREKVARSLRPLLQTDEDIFLAVVKDACRANPISELVATGVGVAIFFAVVGLPAVSPRLAGVDTGFSGSGSGFDWPGLYYYFASMAMFGVMAWSVYAVIVVSRLTNKLLSQPIEIDIFDVTPFEPIGMQSLYLSLAFVGTVVIALPSSPYALPSWQNILIVSALVLISVLVFFVNMYSTHRLLASTRKRQMTIVEHKLAQTYYQLQKLNDSRQDVHLPAVEFNAWAVAKQELKQTRSWPYNTEMLRTLFVTVLIPIMVGLARIVGPLLSR